MTKNNSKQPVFDLGSIVEDVRKIYKKDKKQLEMITTADAIKQSYTEADGVPLREDSPLRVLTGLPCLPYNKIIQFQGDPDTGKSTMIGEAMASAQNSNHVVIVWDTENKFDANRYKKYFKGDPSRIILVKTNEILQGGEKIRKLIIATKTKYPDAKIQVAWDSVGGSQSRSHAERELDNERNSQPGQDAKENGSVMKMLSGLFNVYPDSISVILANQVYAKIGFMQFGNAGSGGKKVEFHSSMIVQMKRLKVLTKVSKGLKIKYGIVTRATLAKNHLSESENSTHQMDFQITAAGAQPMDFQGEDSENGEE